MGAEDREEAIIKDSARDHRRQVAAKEYVPFKRVPDVKGGGLEPEGSSPDFRSVSPSQALQEDTSAKSISSKASQLSSVSRRSSNEECSTNKSHSSHNPASDEVTLPPFSDDIKLTAPLRARQRPLSHKARKVLQDWIHKMTSRGVISKVDPDYPKALLATVVVKDRVTHNCAILSASVRKDGRFPNSQLPQSIWTWSRTVPYLCKIDLSKAFHSIPLQEDQKPYYCFHFQGDHFRYNKMPMGAQGAPKHFHAVMGKIIATLPFAEHVRFYQDDIFIGGSSEDEALQRADRCQTTLENLGFKLNLEKSGYDEKTYVLGMIHDRREKALYIPDEKIRRLRREIDTMGCFSHEPHLWKPAAKSAIGVLSWASDFVPPAFKKAIKRMNADIKDRSFLGADTISLWKQIPDIMAQARLYFCDTTNAATLIFDASATGAAMVVKLGNQTLFTTTVETQRASASSVMELEGAYKAVKKGFIRLKRELSTIPITQVTLMFDNKTAVAAFKDENEESESSVIAQRIRRLIESKFEIMAVNYLPGKINAADAPSRAMQNQEATYGGQQSRPPSQLPRPSHTKKSYLQVAQASIGSHRMTLRHRPLQLRPETYGRQAQLAITSSNTPQPDQRRYKLTTINGSPFITKSDGSPVTHREPSKMDELGPAYNTRAKNLMPICMDTPQVTNRRTRARTRAS